MFSFRTLQHSEMVARVVVAAAQLPPCGAATEVSIVSTAKLSEELAKALEEQGIAVEITGVVVTKEVFTSSIFSMLVFQRPDPFLRSRKGTPGLSESLLHFL